MKKRGRGGVDVSYKTDQTNSGEEEQGRGGKFGSIAAGCLSLILGEEERQGKADGRMIRSQDRFARLVISMIRCDVVW